MTMIQSSVKGTMRNPLSGRTVTTPCRKPSLTTVEKRIVEEALREPIAYVHHELFDAVDAEKQIFDEAPAIPTPNTNWYGPVMETGIPQRDRGAKNAVLDVNQERALFLQFNYARHRSAQLQKEAAIRPLSYVRAKQLIHWFHKARALRDQIAQVSLALVLAMAKRFRATEMEFSDLVSDGNVALMMAIDKFDVGKGFKFSTYACRAILTTFSRSGMKQNRYRRLFPGVYDPEWEDLGRRQGGRHEENDHERNDAVRHFVEGDKAALTDVEREIIHGRFSISGDASVTGEKPMTLEQIGQKVGLTRERVRQIQKSALRKLRRVIEKNDEDDLRYWGRPSGRRYRRR